eukprot:5321845-Lingulodinium_polyedra.AAC.1
MLALLPPETRLLLWSLREAMQCMGRRGVERTVREFVREQAIAVIYSDTNERECAGVIVYAWSGIGF